MKAILASIVLSCLPSTIAFAEDAPSVESKRLSSIRQVTSGMVKAVSVADT